MTLLVPGDGVAVVVDVGDEVGWGGVNVGSLSIDMGEEMIFAVAAVDGSRTAVGEQAVKSNPRRMG